MTSLTINRFTIVNAVLFQALWLSCVIGAGALGLHWLAILAFGLLSAALIWSPVRGSDLTVAAIALVAGLAADNLWAILGILDFSNSALAPYWIGLLWFGMGLTINHSLSWFRDRRYLGPVIVGCFAPVTYFSGERFGAVSVPAIEPMLLVSLSWVAIFYMLSHIAIKRAGASSG